MNEYSFREQTSVDEVYAIAKAAYKGSPWSRQIFEKDLANKHVRYLIIEVAGEPVGFVGGTLIIDELSISNVAIMPGFQGQHLAERLMREWFSRFDDGTRVLLEVRQGNKRAIPLYERLGFTIYNIREDYYSDPVEDAYLMDLMLPLRD
jgi:ribosomal-protein-alanine N-acetyltransferase